MRPLFLLPGAPTSLSETMLLVALLVGVLVGVVVVGVKLSRR